MSAQTAFQEKPIAEALSEAMDVWVDLTGTGPSKTSFSLGDMYLNDMNEQLKTALELDPTGVTSYMLLECFLRQFLEQKAFTAAEIMRDYAKMSDWLKRAEGLFSMVQSDQAVELAAGFRTRVTAGIEHYDANSDDVQAMLNDRDILPFLRRDALMAREKLTAYQFLQGETGGAAQVFDHVYMAWDVNDLLIGLRDMPIDGIAVVIMRDPTHVNRSYFCFAMKNGENITLFTDKSRPAYPGQEDVLAGRARGVARAYASRAYAHYFPYQILKTHFDDHGDVVFDQETDLVIGDKKLVPLMPIKALPSDQVIWLTMMFSLISDRFWKDGWTAPELAYTGKMITDKALLIEDQGGARLPVAKGYQQIGLETVTIDDVTTDKLDDLWSGKSTANPHQWMEDRYKDQVPEEMLNLWMHPENDTLYLEGLVDKEDKERESQSLITTDVPEGTVRVKDMKNLPFWARPKVSALQTFSPSEFGTETELNEDRRYIARHNMAKHIERSAQIEYAQKYSEMMKWYRSRLNKNMDAILDMIAERRHAELTDSVTIEQRRAFGPRIGDVKSDEFAFSMTSHDFGELFHFPTYHACYLDKTKSSWRVQFLPRSADDLAILLGVARKDMPAFFKDWSSERASSGNHLLNRLDPMINVIKDPWKEFPVEVNIYLSKRALTRLEKKFR